MTFWFKYTLVGEPCGFGFSGGARPAGGTDEFRAGGAAGGGVGAAGAWDIDAKGAMSGAGLDACTCTCGVGAAGFALSRGCDGGGACSVEVLGGPGGDCWSCAGGVCWSSAAAEIPSNKLCPVRK